MQLSVYVFACGAFLALSLLSVAEGATIPLYEENEDNNQIENSLDGNAAEFVRPSWIVITKELPPVIRRASGSRIELECEADGGPAPVITWLRDNVPITEADDYENNALIEGTEPGLAKAISRLIINNFLPVDKITYTCLARSGSKSAFTTTTVHTTHNGMPKSTNLSEYLLLNQQVLSAPTKPRIVSFYKTVFETTGNTMVLPCKIMGNPKPEFYWMDSENAVITNQDPRIKIMRSGELIIQDLRWSDMGIYTCVARNALGKDSIDTFVYPTKNN